MAVDGTFDDCQRLVKEAFAARDSTGVWAKRLLTSANSISIGRLLPQMAYYAWASLDYYARTGIKPGFIIPSGNAGNALAAIWAWKMGLPIRELILASNANRALPDYFSTGVFRPAPTVQTIANAMDVGNPSNLERVIHLERAKKIQNGFLKSISVTDDEIRAAIEKGHRLHGVVFCPHTAAAFHARGM